MTPYLLVVAVLMLLGLVAREAAFAGKDLTKPIAAIGCTMLSIMAGLRASNVGADTHNYQNFFTWIASIPFDQVAQADTVLWNSQGTEVTYKFFNKIISLLSSNPQAITLACSVFLGVGLYLLAVRQSQDPWLSLFLYVTMGLFQTAMNIAPSCLAALYAFIGFEFIEKRNFKLFLLCVAVGCIFHYSGLLFIPLYFLAKVRIDLKKVLIALVLLFVTAQVVYPMVVNLLSLVVPARWMQYLAVDRFNVSQLMVWAFYAFIFLVSAFMAGRADKDSSQESVANLMFLLIGAAYALTMCSVSFSRIAILFAPYLIVAVPQYLASVKPCFLNQRALKSLKLPQKASVYANHAKLIVVGVSLGVFILRLSINNIGMTQPYSLCFAM